MLSVYNLVHNFGNFINHILASLLANFKNLVGFVMEVMSSLIQKFVIFHLRFGAPCVIQKFVIYPLSFGPHSLIQKFAKKFGPKFWILVFFAEFISLVEPGLFDP